MLNRTQPNSTIRWKWRWQMFAFKKLWELISSALCSACLTFYQTQAIGDIYEFSASAFPIQLSEIDIEHRVILSHTILIVKIIQLLGIQLIFVQVNVWSCYSQCVRSCLNSDIFNTLAPMITHAWTIIFIRHETKTNCFGGVISVDWIVYLAWEC